jgi:UTP--glucose-1-phosphate uridylyltransferase
MPKELLPVGSKPMIQYTIEAYMDSGICDLCIIVSPQKQLIRKFLTDEAVPAGLPYRHDPLFRDRLKSCHITFLVQERPTGVAHAVALARDFVGSEPFACIMPDCLLFADVPFPQQLMNVYQKQTVNVIGTILIKGKDLERFGNVGLLKSNPIDGHTVQITSLSPKVSEPLRGETSGSHHKGFGGGIYLREYFDLVPTVTVNDTGEIDDVPIHHAMIENQNLLGVRLEGAAFDTGHPLGFRAANHFRGRQTRTVDRVS